MMHCSGHTVTVCTAPHDKRPPALPQDEVTSTASEEQDVGRGWLHYAPPPAQVGGLGVGTHWLPPSN